MVLTNLFLAVSTLGGCGGLERTHCELLLINQYSGSITSIAIAKTRNNIGMAHGYFIRSLGHCISP